GSASAPPPSGSTGAVSTRSARFGGTSGCVSAAAGHAIESDATSARAPRSLGPFGLLIGQVPEVDPQRDVVARRDDAVLDARTEAPAPDGANDRVVLESGGLGLRDAHVRRAAVAIDVERDDDITAERIRRAAQAPLADRLVEDGLQLVEPLAAQLGAVLELAEQLPGSLIDADVGLDLAESDVPVADVAQHLGAQQRILAAIGIEELESRPQRADTLVLRQALLAIAVRGLAQRPDEQQAVLAVHVADQAHGLGVARPLVVIPAAFAQPPAVAVDGLEMLGRGLGMVALRQIQNRELLLVGLDVLIERLERIRDSVEDRHLALVQQPVHAAAHGPRLVVGGDRVQILAGRMVAVAEADQRLDRELRVGAVQPAQNVDGAQVVLLGALEVFGLALDPTGDPIRFRRFDALRPELLLGQGDQLLEKGLRVLGTSGICELVDLEQRLEPRDRRRTGGRLLRVAGLAVEQIGQLPEVLADVA